MSKEVFLKQTEDFFSGVFSMIDDDLPDGAWFQSHVDAAENALSDACEIFNIEKPKGIDGFDITHYYLQKDET